MDITRVFLSLRVQRVQEVLDPYTVTSWQPKTANTIQRLSEKAISRRKSGVFGGRIMAKKDDAATKMPGWDEDQVMVLFPPSGGHRQEIK